MLADRDRDPLTGASPGRPFGFGGKAKYEAVEPAVYTKGNYGVSIVGGGHYADIFPWGFFGYSRAGRHVGH